ncbi:unnamed protein product [Rangifer tarandus platyrhynchus]|uniref:Uncharacterized protein n=1 Tax=Rangifer tarandus platyrhynchus TaxID=3082113 RepID=A0AC59Y497_RANTA
MVSAGGFASQGTPARSSVVQNHRPAGAFLPHQLSRKHSESEQRGCQKRSRDRHTEKPREDGAELERGVYPPRNRAACLRLPEPGGGLGQRSWAATEGADPADAGPQTAASEGERALLGIGAVHRLAHFARSSDVRRHPDGVSVVLALQSPPPRALQAEGSRAEVPAQAEGPSTVAALPR